MPNILALTSDIHTSTGWDEIKALRSARADFVASPQILHERPVQLMSRFDALVFQFTFTFDTPIEGGIGTVRLALGEDSQWRVYTKFTALESLKNVVEKGTGFLIHLGE
ncbi:hypothetical protein GYMLUDRAFT_157527 [Collybiopsis luxurians FD-317 M1]|nr:hypothetical protein GYMLUDRAFT_157527 [Collybiopsis luxurians FD-317 M1]